jgi:serine protease AprX
MRRPFAALLGAVLALPAVVAALPAPAVGSSLDADLVPTLTTTAPTSDLLVFAHGTSTPEVQAAVRDAGLVLRDTFETVDVAVAIGTPAQVRALGSDPRVTYVEPDRPVQFFSNSSHRATALGDVRDAGLTTPDGKKIDGTGIGIAIVDSGIDGTHPAFADDEGVSRVRRNVRFVCAGSSAANCFVDVPANDTDTISAGGHGTHVAGIAGARAVRDRANRDLSGVATNSTLYGIAAGASLSMYGGVAGIDWVARNHANPCAGQVTLPLTPQRPCPRITVVNNSWGFIGGGSFNPNSVTARLQKQLIEAGVVVVWAAGNDGGNGSANVTSVDGEDTTPGVLMVGNYNDANVGTRTGSMAASSSRGRAGQPNTYPDISAPGTSITQACRPYLTVCATGLDRNDPDYNTISGTSMAAPYVAGVVALLQQIDPTLTPAQAEFLLEDTARKTVNGVAFDTVDPFNPSGGLTSFAAGHGLVDVDTAIRTLLQRVADRAAAA